MGDIFDALFSGLASLLAFYYGLVPNYGLAIVLLTLTVMGALAPLTVKQTRSMLAMQRLQPEIKRLQKEHKGDRVALQEAQMALFKEHKVNPLAGCLPMLLQAPVFSVLYWVLIGLKHTVPRAKASPEALRFCREAAARCHDPKYLDRGTDLWQDLATGGGRMVTLGVDLSKAVMDNHGGFVNALPYYLLLAGVVATSYFQLQRLSARNPQAAQQNPQAAMMQKIFPVMSGAITLTVPAGIGLYFIVSNAFRIAQQEAMYRWDPHVSSYAKTAVESAVHHEDPKATKPPKPTKPPKTKAPEPNGSSPPKAGDGRSSSTGRAQPKGSRSRNKKRRRR